MRTSRDGTGSCASSFVICERGGFAPNARLGTGRTISVAFSRVLDRLGLAVRLESRFGRGGRGPVATRSMASMGVGKAVLDDGISFATRSVITGISGARNTATVAPRIIGFGKTSRGATRPAFGCSTVMVPRSIASKGFDVNFGIGNGSCI